MRLITLLFLVFVLFGCDKKETDFLVTIKTEYGDMKAILFDETPKHKVNFLKLAVQGQYDSTVWHRVIEEFMIQGGDINQKPGMKNTIDYLVPAEFNKKFFHKRGAIAAARQNDNVNPEKSSSGSQFYIVNGKVWEEQELVTDMQKLTNQVARLIHVPGYDSIGEVLKQLYQERKFDEYNELMLSLVPAVNERLGMDVSRDIPKERIKVYTTIGGSPWLDDTYTVFGQVLEGLDVIDRIAEVETDRNDRPLKDTYIKIEVEEVPKNKITKLYGYKYPEPK